MATLIIDSRENNVTRHSAELAGTKVIHKMITVGDYAIVDQTGRILISIERKSLEDYASSIKDGRISNIMKMVELRAATGCRLVLLVEGKPRAKHGGIPYKAIESSMWHVALRHHIILIFTKSTVETAETLARLVISVNTLQNGHSPMLPEHPALIQSADTTVISSEMGILDDVCGGDDGGAHTTVPNTGEVAHTTVPNTGEVAHTTVPGALTAVRPKTTIEVARAILAVIRGITIDSADDYLARFSPADILRDADVSGMKLSSGKAPTKRVVGGITQARKTPASWISMLSRVPGITLVAAAELLKHATLPALLTWSAESIGIITVGTTTRGGKEVPKKLPAPTVARLLECFTYKLA